MERKQAIEHLRSHLLRTSAPRLQMTLVLLLTAGIGFLASVLMLTFGITRMAVRYPAAVIFSYLAFILLLRAWLIWQRRQGRTADSNPDLSGIDLPFGGSRTPGPDVEFGGGGGFAGGGAGGSWSGPGPAPQPAAFIQSSPRVAPERAGTGWDLDLDLDDGIIVVVPAVAALAAALASMYVIYVAPALFAELLLDGIVVTALYHRIQRVERRHWLRCVIRRTWIPALLTALTFSIAGHLMQRAVPEAPSIGPFWQAVTGS